MSAVLFTHTDSCVDTLEVSTTGAEGEEVAVTSSNDEDGVWLDLAAVRRLHSALGSYLNDKDNRS